MFNPSLTKVLIHSYFHYRFQYFTQNFDEIYRTFAANDLVLVSHVDVKQHNQKQIGKQGRGKSTFLFHFPILLSNDRTQLSLIISVAFQVLLLQHHSTGYLIVVDYLVVSITINFSKISRDML